MHPTLARQLRRLCGIDSTEALALRLEALEQLQLPSDAGEFIQGLRALLERIDTTYEQHDRDLDLRSRSLELSSAELNAINEKMRADLVSRNRVLQSLREAADKLLNQSENMHCMPAADDLEGLSALLQALVEQQEQSRLELFNQRFALDQHAIVSITDIHGIIQYVNDRFCNISGYSREELLGKHNSIVNSGYHSHEFFHNLWEVLQSGRVWHGDICNQAKNGRRYWVASTLVPFLDDAGKPYQFIGILTDITASKDLASKIMASERQYRTLVESVHDVIFQMDDQGHWIFLNPAWETITGFSLRDSLGKSFLDFVHHDDIDKAFAILTQLCAGDIHTDKSELRFYDNSGHYCWFELNIRSELHDYSKQLILIGTLNNVTEHRRIAKLQSEFVSVVSHELRTPITSIRGSLGLLDAGMAGELQPEAQKLVSIAHKNSQRLVTLVNDILDMEKLMVGQMSLNQVHLNLTTLVEQALEANSAYAKTCNTSLTLCEHPDIAMVTADPDRLMQVLNNLLSNAAKYSPSNRAVEVSIEVVDDEPHPLAKVTVRDYGPGIPPAFRPRLFSAFAQADSSDTRQQGGTGLGLKISKTLIEKMGGNIGVDSELGAGSRFWICLPLVEQAAAL